MATMTTYALSHVAIILYVVTLALTKSPDPETLPHSRQLCQRPTANPLLGCPDATILVGPNEQYTSIQSAIVALPADASSQTILVLPGTYTEQLNVTRPGPLTILGQTSKPSDLSSNSVGVLWRAVAGTGDNAYTAVLTIAPDLNAALTGSGPTGWPIPPDQQFGNADFRAYNVNFTNDYAPYSDGPSLTLSTGYANSGFYHCSFASYQDTIYVGKNASTYIAYSAIAGETDFLYGFGTLWVKGSTLLLRSCGGGITAWKGSNTTLPNNYGAYINHATIQKANSTLNITGQCSLGRPWNSQHRSVFANTYEDDSITPAGYTEWSDSDPRVTSQTFMAEYRDYGPGFNLTARLTLGANVTKELNEEQWAPYSSPAEVFQFWPDGGFGNTAWIDFEA